MGSFGGPAGEERLDFVAVVGNVVVLFGSQGGDALDWQDTARIRHSAMGHLAPVIGGAE